MLSAAYSIQVIGRVVLSSAVVHVCCLISFFLSRVYSFLPSPLAGKSQLRFQATQSLSSHASAWNRHNSKTFYLNVPSGRTASPSP